MEIGSVKLISNNLSTVFTISYIILCHMKEFDDYITLYNPSMLLTFVVTLYLIPSEARSTPGLDRVRYGFFASF